MDNNVAQKTVSGFAYKFAERAGAQSLHFLLQLILARLLLPAEYGLIALVSIFIMICDVFVTYGFGNSLVADKNSDALDFSTCFYFGLFLSLLIYAALFCVSPWIGSFFDNPLLVPVLRVMGLRIPIAAVNSVQHAYVQKHMWFRKFFFATLIGTIVSGIVAVIMAYHGFGVWALVEQYLGNVVLDTLCLWVIVGWRPGWEFSWKRLKAIYDYGWKILVVGLIDTIYNRLRNLVIGKLYSGQGLAYYDRGYHFSSFGMRLIEPTVNSVLFPALALCRGNREQMRNITRKVILASSYIVSPVLLGMAVVAKPLVLSLLTEKWLPCTFFLQVGCFANLFRTNQFINTCVIKANGESGLLLKLDCLKKSLGLLILGGSLFFGLEGIAWSVVVVYFLSMIINIAPNRRILGYGYLAQFKDLLINVLTAAAMATCIYPITFLDIAPWKMLVLQIPAGCFIYLWLSWLTRNEGLALVVKIAGKWKRMFLGKFTAHRFAQEKR